LSLLLPDCTCAFFTFREPEALSARSRFAQPHDSRNPHCPIKLVINKAVAFHPFGGDQLQCQVTVFEQLTTLEPLCAALKASLNRKYSLWQSPWKKKMNAFMPISSRRSAKTSPPPLPCLTAC